jgi:uncharacterized protein YuzE
MEKRITPTIARGDSVSTEPIFRAMPYLIRFPSQRFWVDYDEEADVLYISFRHPQEATDSEMTDEGILLRYRGDELVGMTILGVAARMESKA